MGALFRASVFFFLLSSVFHWSCVNGDLLIVTDGNYSVGARGQDYWLTSGPFFLNHNGHRMDTDNGSLKTGSAAYASSGRDKLGQWQDTTWLLSGPDNVTLMKARIRTYPLDRPGVVIFTQTFPVGLNRSRSDNNDHTISGFPTFRVKEGVTNTSLAYLMFAGYMMGDRSKTYGRWTPATAHIRGGLDGSGPLVVFDQQGGVILISPMDHSMAASVWMDGQVLAWGVMGGVDSLPPGFALQTLLYYGTEGVTEAFDSWGGVLRQWYGKTEDVVRYHQQQDITLTHLGYWTDNGAYYYYHTEKGENYEQTLPDVMSYASRQQIPYRYLQLDSWWYPKDSIKAVTTWDAMPQIFPHGLRDLAAALKLPFAAHNRYWSVNTTYAKQHGGHFDFFIGHRLSLPLGQEFWDWLLKTSAEWGLRLYEQDWLNVQLLGTELLQTNLTAGADWLNDMARGARANDMKIQYCMSQSRHALHSLLWPEVTQARVTDDYLLNPVNWKIGVTSHFAAALGLAPSKDTFWTTSVQPGNPFNKSEPYPELQSAVATLSTGPVGPGDGINLTNRDTLMRCCAADGLILKPSRPPTAIDGVFLEMGFGEGQGTSGEVWSTYTTFDDVMTFGIILAVNVSRAYNVTPSNVGFRALKPQFPQSRLFVRDAPHKMYNFSDLQPFDISTCDTSLPPYFCLFYTAPVLQLGGQELVVLGELDKWVPMSPQRVLSLHHTPSSLTLSLRGQPGENVTFTFLKGQEVMNVSAVADAAGCATVRVSVGGEPSSSVFVARSSVKSKSASAARPTAGSPISVLSDVVHMSAEETSCRFVPPPFTTPPSPSSVTSQQTSVGPSNGVEQTSVGPSNGVGVLRAWLLWMTMMVMTVMTAGVGWMRLESV